MSVFGMPRMGYGVEQQDSPSATAGSLPSSTEPGSRSAPRLGPWDVGNLDPLLVKALTVVGFALPVVVYLVFLQHYQVNAMWQDQWDDVPVIRQSFGHFPDWSSLWVQHVDNRIFFPNLIVVALAHTVHYNITVEDYLSALMLFAATALFIWSHKRRSPRTPLLFYCPVAFLTLTLAQWQNTIWGFQMAWYLVLLSLAVTIALLDWPRLAWPIFALAVCAAVVGSFSSLQGLLIWPVGLVLLYHRRRPLWTAAVWVVAAALTTALYFHNFTSSKVFNPNETILKRPFDAVKFFVFALGDVVGLQETKPEHSNPWIMAFGVVILVLAVLVIIRWGLRRDEHSAAPIGIALILYGLLFDALITQGRLFLLYFAASASRYTTNDVLVLAGIYLTALDRSSAKQRVEARSQTKTAGGSEPFLIRVRRRVDQIGRIPLRQMALAAIVIQIVFSVGFSFSGAQGLHDDEVRAVAVSRNIDHEPTGVVEFDLYFVRKASWLREQTQFLQNHHLAQFGG
jgi:hypothetical protein